MLPPPLPTFTPAELDNAVVIVSGGMDSVTLLHYLRKAYRMEITAMSVNYGQRHRKELEFAAEQCRLLAVEHVLVDAGFWGSLIPTSSLTSDAVAVPEGHYAEENMKATVVPARNMLLLSMATSLAVARGAEWLAFGAHAGDHAIYPDCRPEFHAAMEKAIQLCDYRPPVLLAPFIGQSKADILRIGLALGVDYSKTWTCYKGGEIACGKCGTCVERLEAFAANNAEDPLPYEDRTSWREIIAKGVPATN